MAKYLNLYRSETHRMTNWRYDSEALYYLTFNTQNRVKHLSRVLPNNEIELTDFGEIVNHQWLKSFQIRDELILHAYVIMPDHIHAIVEIKHPDNPDDNAVAHANRRSHPTNPENPDNDAVVHANRRSHPTTNAPSQTKIPHQLPRSISSFMSGFKSAVNTKIDDYIDEHQLAIPKYNRHNHFFQNNYNDTVIRNDSDYERIKKYIINNPKKWNDDRLKHS